MRTAEHERIINVVRWYLIARDCLKTISVNTQAVELNPKLDNGQIVISRVLELCDGDGDGDERKSCSLPANSIKRNTIVLVGKGTTMLKAQAQAQSEVLTNL